MGGHWVDIIGVPQPGSNLTWRGWTCLAALVICLGGLSEPAAGQPIEGLDSAVAFYHEYATSDLAHLQKAASLFEAITIAYPVNNGRPDAWLPAYWAALGYSQVALFADDARTMPFLRLAEAYYAMAFEVGPDSDTRVEADFMALRGLIEGLLAGADPPDSAGHRSRSREYWERARALDPENPMMLMNGGLALLPSLQTRELAYQLLDRAIALYEERQGSVQPNWGREFIDVRTGAYPRISGASR